MALNTLNHKIIGVSAMFMIPLLIIILVLCHSYVVLSATFTLLPLPSGASAPSSFAFPLNGQFFTSVIDGRILQFQPLTRNFVQVGFTTPTRSRATCDNVTIVTPSCGRPLGLQVHRASNVLYICDAFAGLLTLTSSDRLATPISTVAEGQSIRFCNGLDVDQIAGDVYFTDFSSVFNITTPLQDIIAVGDLTGRLLKYDIDSRQSVVLLRNMSGPAGVALSLDRSYLVVSELLANRTIKYYLSGPKMDTFNAINMQPRPNKVRTTLAGDFWEAAIQPPMTPIGQRINGFGVEMETVNFGPYYGNNAVSQVEEYGGVLYVGSRSPNVTFVGMYNPT